MGGGHRRIGNARNIRSNLLSNGLKNRPHLFHSACLDINKNSVFYICFPAWFIAILLSSNQFVCFTGSTLPPPQPPSTHTHTPSLCFISGLRKAVLHPADKHRECRGAVLLHLLHFRGALPLSLRECVHEWDELNSGAKHANQICLEATLTPIPLRFLPLPSDSSLTSPGMDTWMEAPSHTARIDNWPPQ